jgi:tRNA (cmo5U34)-methyltransferase
MLQRSIPQYDVMRSAATDIGASFVTPDSYIVDLGCSRGEALARFVKTFGERNNYMGLEISEPMIQVANQRFKDSSCNIIIKPYDLRKGVTLPDYVTPSLIISVLTLQFTPIEYRQRIVSDVHRLLPSGGAFVLVEKVIGESTLLDEAMIKIYRKMKITHGYSQESIDRKRLSLEGVLVPLTSSWNESLLRNAGFNVIDCFWRWMNFSSWVAVKL